MLASNCTHTDYSPYNHCAKDTAWWISSQRESLRVAFAPLRGMPGRGCVMIHPLWYPAFLPTWLADGLHK